MMSGDGSVIRNHWHPCDEFLDQAASLGPAFLGVGTFQTVEQFSESNRRDLDALIAFSAQRSRKIEAALFVLHEDGRFEHYCHLSPSGGSSLRAASKSSRSVCASSEDKWIPSQTAANSWAEQLNESWTRRATGLPSFSKRYSTVPACT
jgi:hypothetical protein